MWDENDVRGSHPVLSLPSYSLADLKGMVIEIDGELLELVSLPEGPEELRQPRAEANGSVDYDSFDLLRLRITSSLASRDCR